MKTVDPFAVMGIAIRTANEDGKAEEDLKELWKRFYDENISLKIPNKEDDKIYCIYTDYDSDMSGAYTAIIGQKVTVLDDIPDQLIGHTVLGGDYTTFTTASPQPSDIVNTWQQIWDQDKTLNRAYTADFEEYDGDAAVTIYIAVMS